MEGACHYGPGLPGKQQHSYPLSPLVGKGKISREQVPLLAAVVSLCLVPVFSVMMGDAPTEELTAVGIYNQSVSELEIFLNYQK